MFSFNVCFLEYQGFVWPYEKQKVKLIQNQIVSDGHDFFWELRCMNLDTCMQVSPWRCHRWVRDSVRVSEHRYLSQCRWKGLDSRRPNRLAPSGQGRWKPGQTALGISNGSSCHLSEQLKKCRNPPGGFMSPGATSHVD